MVAWSCPTQIGGGSSARLQCDYISYPWIFFRRSPSRRALPSVALRPSPPRAEHVPSSSVLGLDRFEPFRKMGRWEEAKLAWRLVSCGAHRRPVTAFGTGELSGEAPPSAFSLADAVGISSAAFASVLVTATWPLYDLADRRNPFFARTPCHTRFKLNDRLLAGCTSSRNTHLRHVRALSLRATCSASEAQEYLPTRDYWPVTSALFKERRNARVFSLSPLCRANLRRPAMKHVLGARSLGRFSEQRLPSQIVVLVPMQDGAETDNTGMPLDSIEA